MSAPLRVGLMSAAHVHADAYAQLLQEMQDTELIGVSDPEPNRLEGFCESHGARAFTSHEALLEERPDAVIICSETVHHAADVALAAQAGAHILCEKPISTRLEDAEAMRRDVEAADVIFMTAFPMRFDSNILEARALLERGDLGRLYAIKGVNHSENPKRHRAWFAVKALAGGGAIMDHTVHLLDLYRWLTGEEARELYAEVSNPFDPELDVDTAGLVTLSFTSGIFASIDCSWSRPPTYPRWGHLHMELFGEKGGLRVDAFAQHLKLYQKDARKPVSWPAWGSDPNRAMLEDFLDSIRNEHSPGVSFEDGYEALKLALACYGSAEQAAPVYF